MLSNCIIVTFINLCGTGTMYCNQILTEALKPIKGIVERRSVIKRPPVTPQSLKFHVDLANTAPHTHARTSTERLGH